MDLTRRAERAAEWIAAAWRLPEVAEAMCSPTAVVKADSSPVTVADRAIEEYLRAAIADAYPTDGVLGEECAPVNPGCDRQWIIDPIDGTKAFMAGFPTYTTLLSYAESGGPKIGVIYQPVTQECWVGIAGTGSRRGEKPIATRSCTTLSDAFFSTTSPAYFAKDELPKIQRILDRSRWHQLGADGYAYAQLASGRIDAIVESGLQIHDFMAHAAVISEAGGIITDWQGMALNLLSDGRICAAGDPALHAELLRELAGG